MLIALNIVTLKKEQTLSFKMVVVSLPILMRYVAMLPWRLPNVSLSLGGTCGALSETHSHNLCSTIKVILL